MLCSAMAYAQYDIWVDLGEHVTPDTTASRTGSTIQNPWSATTLLYVFPTYKELTLSRSIREEMQGIPTNFSDPAWPSKYTPLGSPSPSAKGGYIEADPAGDNLLPGEQAISGIGVRTEISNYAWENDAMYAYGFVTRYRSWEIKTSAFHVIRPIPH